MKALFSLLCSLFLSFFAYSQNATQLRLDDILKEAFTQDAPGAAAIVTKNGNIIYHKAIGKANLELDMDVRTDHIFRIGSITKQFTAVSILMLVEEGKMTLQDDLTKFLPDYPTKGKKITVEHLLTHTSGIKSYTNMPSFFNMDKKEFTVNEMIDVFKNEPMEFDPGTAYNYNNSGYFLLGAIIEKVSGMTYSDFLQERIFNKIGLKNTFFDSNSKVIPNRIPGYSQDIDSYNNAMFISPTVPYAAGSIISTVEDLFNWNQALHAGKLVAKDLLGKAFTKYTLANGEKVNYGYGWSIDQVQGSPSIEHGGGIFGFTTQAIYLPEEDVFVAVFANCDCARPNPVAVKMAALALGKPYEAPKDLKIAQETLKNYEGTYDFGNNVIRVITHKEGKLFSRRSGGRTFELLPLSENKFLYDESFSTIEFLDKKEGEKEAVFIERNGSKAVGRLNNEIKVTAERVAITLEASKLEQLAGTYELMPGFNIVFRTKEGHFFAQATGQAEFEIFPFSETDFFVKAFSAEFKFVSNEEGHFNKVILFQNGAEVPGKRIE